MWKLLGQGSNPCRSYGLATRTATPGPRPPEPQQSTDEPENGRYTPGEGRRGREGTGQARQPPPPRTGPRPLPSCSELRPHCRVYVRGWASGRRCPPSCFAPAPQSPRARVPEAEGTAPSPQGLGDGPHLSSRSSRLPARKRSPRAVCRTPTGLVLSASGKGACGERRMLGVSRRTLPTSASSG